MSCATCDDTGRDPDGGYCRCGGGEVAAMWDGARVFGDRVEVECSFCRGCGGGHGSQRCPRCHGRGTIRVEADSEEAERAHGRDGAASAP